MAAVEITAKRLRELVIYNPDTGIFTWRIGRKKASVGVQIGCREPRGYLICRVEYRRYYLHRLAWLYMTGEWPKDEVDHKDRDKGNNAWSNLREATTKQNLENISPRSKSHSGAVGVDWSKRHKLWHARICHNKVPIHLGWFRTLEAAIAARTAAELKYFTHSPACELRDGSL